MNLEADSTGLMVDSRASTIKIGLMSKRDSEGSSNSSSSMDKSDISPQGIMGSPPGVIVNGPSIDQNQNCTEMPAVLTSLG